MVLYVNNQSKVVWWGRAPDTTAEYFPVTAHSDFSYTALIFNKKEKKEKEVMNCFTDSVCVDAALFNFLNLLSVDIFNICRMESHQSRRPALGSLWQFWELIYKWVHPPKKIIPKWVNCKKSWSQNESIAKWVDPKMTQLQKESFPKWVNSKKVDSKMSQSQKDSTPKWFNCKKSWTQIESIPKWVNCKKRQSPKEKIPKWHNCKKSRSQNESIPKSPFKNVSIAKWVNPKRSQFQK